MMNIISTNGDVQCERGTSPVQMRVYSTSEAHHQVLGKGGTTQGAFTNQYELKMVSS